MKNPGVAVSQGQGQSLIYCRNMSVSQRNGQLSWSGQDWRLSVLKIRKHPRQTRTGQSPAEDTQFLGKINVHLGKRALEFLPTGCLPGQFMTQARKMPLLFE